MSKKKLEIIIFFISFFSLLFFIKQYNHKENSLFRQLNPTVNEIEEICKKSSYDLYNYYYQENRNIEEPKYKDNEEYILSLIQIMDKDNTNNKENMKTYLKHLIPNLIILGFTLISIIIWILFLICGMCKKCNKCSCCLKQNCKSGIYLFLFILSLGSFILSINGITKTKKLFSNFDKISCSLFKFVYDITEGETTKSTNKWSGIDGINNLISNINKILISRNIRKNKIDLDVVESACEFKTILKNNGAN